MTRKSNNRFIVIGLIAGIAAIPAGLWFDQTRSMSAYAMTITCFAVLFFSFGILGIFARSITFLLDNPTWNTQMDMKDISKNIETSRDFPKNLSRQSQAQLKLYMLIKLLGLYVSDNSEKDEIQCS